MKKVDMLKKILNAHALVYITLLICFNCHGFENDFELHKDVRKVKSEKKSKKNPLKTYLLPRNHPLQPKLENLFNDPHMFQTGLHLQHAGFKVKMGHRQLMVGEHPTIPSFLFKKFIDWHSKKMQLENYTRRINNANKLRRYFKKKQFHYLTVPEKWLYELPPAFDDEDNTKGYVLIVEKMDIYDDWNDPQGEARRLYYNMDKEMLTQLCITLHELGGCDAFPRNQPFTRSGQLAFIDTEHLGEKKLHFIKHIVPALNSELQEYALDLWNQLEREQREAKQQGATAP